MKNYSLLPLLSIAAILPSAAFADQGVPINYDNLSFFEEPLAVELGPATLSAKVLVDQSVRYNFSDDNDSYNTRVNGEFTFETQLPNTVQAGVTYVSRYDRLTDSGERDEYTDDVAVFIADEWGTFAGGNVTGSVREKVRRQKPFGNADLKNDEFVGGLDETGGFYSVRYNSYEVSVTADQEGRAEAGLSFSRPMGKNVYTAGARFRKGDTTESTATGDDGETYGGSVIGEYTYASTLIGAEVGYETVDLNTASDNNDHVFGAVGLKYKYGAYRFSAEGGLNRYDGEDKRAFALGTMIDFARGASLNFGLNYTHENDDGEDLTGITSMRYEL